MLACGYSAGTATTCTCWSRTVEQSCFSLHLELLARQSLSESKLGGPPAFDRSSRGSPRPVATTVIAPSAIAPSISIRRTGDPPLRLETLLSVTQGFEL